MYGAIDVKPCLLIIQSPGPIHRRHLLVPIYPSYCPLPAATVKGGPKAIAKRLALDAKWKQDSRPPTAPIAPPRGTLDETNKISWQLRQRTAEFLDLLYRDDAFAASSGNYADQVSYYGKSCAREQVMTELRNFTNRWPLRQYIIRRGSLVIDCDEQALTCSATGLLDFDS